MFLSVQIYGERHSGTKWLQKLLERNYQVRVDWPFGFKHWTPPADLPDDGEVAFVAIFRNPFDWVRAMHTLPWHTPAHVDVSMKEFLDRRWESYDGEGWDGPNRFSIVREENLIERYESVFALRRAKIRTFKDVGRRVRRFAWVRYEDLCAAPRRNIQLVAQKLQLRRRRRPVMRINRKRPTRYAPFDEACRRTVVERLDWDAEWSVGYSRAAYALEHGTLAAA